MQFIGHSKYPKEVQIKSDIWKIKFVKVIERDPILLGLTIWPDRVIKIKKGQKKSELLATYAHEIIHAFEFEYGFKLKHKHVSQLEEALLAFILTNH